jgi:hypothetical protein
MLCRIHTHAVHTQVQGAKARSEQVKSFCAQQLKPYDTLFPPSSIAGPTAAGPESMDRYYYILPQYYICSTI